jgi:hypothetical protein
MVRAYTKTLHMPNKYKNLDECISYDAMQSREDGCERFNEDSQDRGSVILILLHSPLFILQMRFDLVVVSSPARHSQTARWTSDTIELRSSAHIIS